MNNLELLQKKFNALHLEVSADIVDDIQSTVNAIIEEKDRQIKELEEDRSHHLKMLDESCYEIDFLGYRSDDYGGPNLPECIKNLGEKWIECRDRLTEIHEILRDHDNPDDCIGCGCLMTPEEVLATYTKERIESLRSLLKEFYDAEWMVSHDWGGDRDSILKKVELALGEDNNGS